jgi:D-alanine transaminase
MQITRGQTNRIPYCPKNLTPTICATVSPRKKVSEEEFARGFSLMTHEDIRWKRCDIKTVGLLASALINQKAKDHGFDDAIFLRDGIVTEATYANAFIVDENDVIITKAPDNLILCGITRNRLLKIAAEKNIKIAERNFSLEEMMRAKEVFLTSSSLILRPISKIDGKLIAGGKNRKIARILNDAYGEFVSSDIS